MKSILQDWVMELGLRHQGVLVSAVRGCDTSPKHDPSKLLVRCLRAAILNPHAPTGVAPRTFIEIVDPYELFARMGAFSADHLPHHYVMHLVHAVEILGYKHPDDVQRGAWYWFYARLCKGLHLPLESEEKLDDRLNAEEAAFAAGQVDGGHGVNTVATAQTSSWKEDVQLLGESPCEMLRRAVQNGVDRGPIIVVISGPPASGKTWISGLLCEAMGEDKLHRVLVESGKTARRKVEGFLARFWPNRSVILELQQTGRRLENEVERAVDAHASPAGVFWIRLEHPLTKTKRRSDPPSWLGQRAAIREWADNIGGAQ